MIGSFRHKGLRKLYEDNLAKGVNPDHVRKLRQILLVLQAAQQIEALKLPTFRLHPLTGDLEGFWSITVRANWRVIFRFEDGKALDIDLVDYH
jgi:proteic killer suppression protein